MSETIYSLGLEFEDYIPALLAGIKDPKEVKRSICAAGEKKSGFKTTEEVQAKVCRIKEEKYIPREKDHKVYQKLFKLYCRLHDSFGIQDSKDDLYPIMKELLKIKNTYL